MSGIGLGLGGGGINGSLGYGSSGIGGSMFANAGGVAAGNDMDGAEGGEERQEQQMAVPAGSDDEEGDYEPNLEEIHGYAKFLGINMETDQEFLFIAEEGLKAPVPEPWKTYFNENDEIFYVNPVTQEKMFDHPLDEQYRQKFLKLKAERDAKNNIGMGSANQFMQGDPNGGGQAMFNALNPLNNKTGDPLIRAEAEKKLKEQKFLYQQEYQQSLEEIDKNFELKKQELIRQNEQEIEREKVKWDKYKKDQEKKIRDEIEGDIDMKIQSFKDELRIEEEREVRRIEDETKSKLHEFERDLSKRFDSEKHQLTQHYSRHRQNLEASEQERFDFEIEKFKKDQNKLLEGKKVDISKLKSEKRKVQGEYDEQVDQLKKDMERKLEREKRDISDQMQREIEDVEREEKQKYEKKVQQMKKELQLASAAPDMEKELADYRQQQEIEYEGQVREFKREQDKLIADEEERLERSRQIELDEYEETLNKQFEAELRRKQQQINMTREQEEKELEIMKLRIDQQQQDKVEQFRKEMQNKYAKERRQWEEEKQKKLYEIQDSIDDLNLAASDKTKLKGEIDDQIKEQNNLSDKIDTLNFDRDDQENKNRLLEREINELNIQLNANRVTSGAYSKANENDARINELRDEIARKNVQISQQQREYKHLLENPPPKRQEQPIDRANEQDENDNHASNQAPAAGDSHKMQKLENELSEIKTMLHQQQELQRQVAYSNPSGHMSDDKSMASLISGQQNEDEIRKYISSQKAMIKATQEKLEIVKKEYKNDKKHLADGDMQNTNPNEYERQKAKLADAKIQIEDKIDKMNQKVEKIKHMEKKLQNQQR